MHSVATQPVSCCSFEVPLLEVTVEVYKNLLTRMLFSAHLHLIRAPHAIMQEATFHYAMSSACCLAQELEQHAKEEWLQELGLGPSDLQMLPSCEPRGDHLFVEPSEAISPLVSCTRTRRAGVRGCP